MMKIAVSIPDLHFRAESLAQFQFSFYDRLIPSLSLSPPRHLSAPFSLLLASHCRKKEKEKGKKKKERRGMVARFLFTL